MLCWMHFTDSTVDVLFPKFKDFHRGSEEVSMSVYEKDTLDYYHIMTLHIKQDGEILRLKSQFIKFKLNDEIKKILHPIYPQLCN